MIRSKTGQLFILIGSLYLLSVVMGRTAFAQANAGGGAGQAGDSLSLNERLSAVYVEQAATAVAEKRRTTADQLISVALEFNSSNSDAYFLRGDEAYDQKQDIPAAIQAYSAAVEHDQWSKYRPSACKLKLAPLLLRTKQYERALTILQSFTNDAPEYLLEYASALDGLGRVSQARNTLESAMNAYPSDYSLAVERIKVDPTYRGALTARFVANQDVARFPQAVLEALIRYTSDPAQKTALVAVYDGRFPRSAAVFAQSLLASRSVTTAQIDTFVQDGSLSRANLVAELYSSIRDPKVKAYLAAKAASYTGTVTQDLNGDGIPEVVAVYSNGKMTSLTYDGDQDGVSGLAVTFASGEPASLTVDRGGTTFVLTYTQYPFIGSATATTGQDVTRYTVIPGRISAPVLGSGTTLSTGISAFPPGVHAGYSISKSELFAFSTEITNSTVAAARPVDIYRRSLDDILHMESQWESGSYSYRAVFHGNEKFSAERDIDGDGYYEVKEYYRGGRLWKLTYDGDHEENPEFILEYIPYPVLSWDYNQDGIIDAIEKRLPDGTVVKMFSTKMNGVFDVVTKEVKK